MRNNYIAIITIWIAAIILVAMTFSLFPGFLREKADLYNSTEYAQMYLNDDKYEDLEIEYDYVKGYGPTDGSRNQLIHIINKYCDKNKVEDHIDDKIRNEDRRNFYTEEDIFDLNDEYQDIHREEDTVNIHVLFLDGEWKKDTDVLGLSYDGDKIVIFKQAIMSISSKSSLDVLEIEKSVIIHEFGHLISLVGINYNSEHEVGDHHCDQKTGKCAMASSVEVNIGELSEKPPADFCEQCQEDIEEIKEKEIGRGLEEYITYAAIISEVGIFIGISVSLKPEQRYPYQYQDNNRVRNDRYGNEDKAYYNNEYTYDNYNQQKDNYNQEKSNEKKYY